MISVAVFWLANQKGQLLLARRADDKKQDPGLWGPSVTGKVEPGETFEQALTREISEELNLSPEDYTNPKVLLSEDFSHPDGELRRMKVYFSKIANQDIPKIKFDPVEVAEIDWRDIDTLREMLVGKTGEPIVHSASRLWPPTFAKIEAEQL